MPSAAARQAQQQGAPGARLRRCALPKILVFAQNACSGARTCPGPAVV